MRIKFEKGFTPEAMTDALLSFIKENNLLIGSVNVFIQLYGEDGKAINDFKDSGMYIYKPPEYYKEEYTQYAAKLRRKSFKAV